MVSNYGLEPICKRIASDIVLTSASGIVDTYLSAPEILTPPDSEYSTYTPESDSYDFGSFMLEVLSGRMPFEKQNKFRTFMHVIEKGKPIPKDHPNLLASDPIWDVMYACWSFSPEERPSMEQLSAIVSKSPITIYLH